MGAVRIGGQPGDRAHDLLEDQQVTGTEREAGIGQRGRRRAGLQAAPEVAPGPQRDLVVFLVQRDVLAHERLEYLGARAEPEIARRHGHRAGHGQAHVGAGRAPVVHPVVDQPCVPPHRGPQPGRIEVGLGARRVEAVVEQVAGVGQQFDQRDADVGQVLLGPVRHGQAEPVEQRLPQAGVVAGQVVDHRSRRRRGDRGALRHAVHQRGAVLLEREVRVEAAHVETVVGVGAGPPVRAGGDHAEPVAREVARPVDAQLQAAGQVRILLGARLYARHGDRQAAVDPEVRLGQAGRYLAEQDHRQRALVVADRDAVDPVQAVRPRVDAAPRVSAAELGSRS